MIKKAKSGENSKSDVLSKLLIARQETKLLYQELEKVKRQTRDTTLFKTSSQINSISTHEVDLKLYNTLRGHRNKISQVRWNLDSRHLISASQDGYMIIWDALTGFKKQLIELDNQWVLTCAFAPNGQVAGSGGLDNTLTIYDVRDKGEYSLRIGQLTIKLIFKGHKAYISDCDFITNQQVLTASGDMTCAMWDLVKGGKVRDFIDHIGDVLTLSVIPKIEGQSESPLLISGSSDGYAKVWDSRSQVSVQNFPVSNSDVTCVKMFPGNYSFITGSDDGVIRMFDLRSDCELSNYSLVSQLSSLENNYHPTQSEARNSVQLSSSPISQKSKQESVNSNYDSLGVLSLDFSKSGRLIYSCYSDYGCLIWDTFKGTIVGKMAFAGHVNRVNDVCVSPDGTGLCTASWDQTIKVWSV